MEYIKNKSYTNGLKDLKPFVVHGFLEPWRMMCVVSFYNIHLFVEDDGSTEPVIYIKNNGTWTQFSKVYKKINGAWVEQTDPATVLNTTKNYVKG